MLDRYEIDVSIQLRVFLFQRKRKFEQHFCGRLTRRGKLRQQSGRGSGLSCRRRLSGGRRKKAVAAASYCDPCESDTQVISMVFQECKGGDASSGLDCVVGDRCWTL